jgi:hypothetical protein
MWEESSFEFSGRRRNSVEAGFDVRRSVAVINCNYWLFSLFCCKWLMRPEEDDDGGDSRGQPGKRSHADTSL